MTMFRPHEVKRTTLICVGLFSALIGLWLPYMGVRLAPRHLVFIVPLVAVTYRKGWLAFLGALCIGCMFGVLRGQLAIRDLQQYGPLYNKVHTFTARVADDPGYDELRNQTIFHISSIVTTQRALPGRIQVDVAGTVSIKRGDSVIVSGKLLPMPGTAQQGIIITTKITVVQKNNSLVEALRNRFFRAVHMALPEPEASIGLGYLVGLRVSIPKEVSDQLNIVGLTHIIAVSGYNLTIIVQAVRRLFGKRSAYQSVVLSAALIVGFLLIAGGSAPINRAAVVCSLGLLSWYYGREFKPVLLLLLSGFVTACAVPMYVWGDPGWYLSFLAFTGILVVSPLLLRLLFKQKTPGVLAQILVETTSAQICTIPYTLFLFGRVSVIAPVSNLLILPFIPFVMLGVFLVGLTGMLSTSLARVVAVIPSSLITLQLWLIAKLSHVPWAYIQHSITGEVMALAFGLIVICILLLQRVAEHSEKSAD